MKTIRKIKSILGITAFLTMTSCNDDIFSSYLYSHAPSEDYWNNSSIDHPSLSSPSISSSGEDSSASNSEISSTEDATSSTTSTSSSSYTGDLLPFQTALTDSLPTKSIEIINYKLPNSDTTLIATNTYLFSYGDNPVGKIVQEYDLLNEVGSEEETTHYKYVYYAVDGFLYKENGTEYDIVSGYAIPHTFRTISLDPSTLDYKIYGNKLSCKVKEDKESLFMEQEGTDISYELTLNSQDQLSFDTLHYFTPLSAEVTSSFNFLYTPQTIDLPAELL